MSKITSLTRLRARVRGALMVRRPAQILVMFAFGIVAMMAFAGFAIDTGMLLTTRRNFQKVADICATVGAQAIPGGGAIARAQDCITTNNVSGGATVNVPPTSGLKAGNNRYVEVVIDQNVRTYFLQAVGIRTVPIGVRAVGSACRALEYAVVGLRPDTNSVRTSGGSSSRIIGNACSRNDFQVSGTLNITGWAVANGSFSGLPSATGTESGPGSDPCLDPLFPLPYLPTLQPLVGSSTVTISDSAGNCPTASNPTRAAPVGYRLRISCGYTAGTLTISPPRDQVDIQGSNRATIRLQPSGTTPSNATYRDVQIQGTGPVILGPGIYDTINVISDANVTFNPGLFLINSSYDQGGGGDLTGTGVSIIVGHQFEATGNGNLLLSCCSAGMEHNVLFYHYGGTIPTPGTPAMWPATGPNEINITGNSGSRILNGSIYSPLVTPDACNNPCISIGGNADTFQVNGQVIGATIDFHGTGTTVNYPDISDRAIPRPYLAE